MKTIKLFLCFVIFCICCGCHQNHYPKGQSMMFYNACDYGVNVESEDNSEAMQKLIDLVSENGGGTIYIPNGIYRFKGVYKAPWNDSMYTLMAKSNVSIVGENIEKTVLKHESLASLFFHQGSLNNIISGCEYRNFTVDSYDSGNENKVYGKAFFYQYVKNCIFEDLILKGSVATAMGIDYLDQVTINNVTTIDCGRTYSGVESGSSGIGIGLGGFEDENFYITNCTAINSGQYGIFVENQHALGWGGHSDESCGMIISNCIVRNGKNKGIGIRGGNKVLVSDCLIYNNQGDGIYLDGYCQDIKVENCEVSDNAGNGITIETDDQAHDLTFSNNSLLRNQNGIVVNNKKYLTNLSILNNVIYDNQLNGIEVLNDVNQLVIMQNVTKNQQYGIQFNAITLQDCAIIQNVLYDEYFTLAKFKGNNTYNEFYK